MITKRIKVPLVALSSSITITVAESTIFTNSFSRLVLSCWLSISNRSHRLLQQPLHALQLQTTHHLNALQMLQITLPILLITLLTQHNKIQIKEIRTIVDLMSRWTGTYPLALNKIASYQLTGKIDKHLRVQRMVNRSALAKLTICLLLLRKEDQISSYRKLLRTLFLNSYQMTNKPDNSNPLKN